MTRCLILICVLAAAACSGKPEPKIQTLSDVSLADDAVSLAISEAIGGDVAETIVAEAPAPKTGLLGRIFSNAKPVDIAVPVVETSADVAVIPVVVAQVVAPAPAPKRGFFGRLFGVGPPVEQAAIAPADVPAPQQAGILSGVFLPAVAVPRTGPDARDVSPGTILPYGEIARNCTVTRHRLGTIVDENAGYKLYDTASRTTALRTHYITGFKDKCARQFTAATSMMGDIGTHEIVRYLPSNAKMEYSAADTAYEAIKSSYCRVGHGKPCGGKLDRLARRTTFITAYQRFGVNPTWSSILLHEGSVAAMGPAEP